MPVRVAVLDLLGTVVTDGGLVLDAVRRGLGAVGVPCSGPRFPALERQAVAAMDRPTLRIFADLLDGDLHRARPAAAACEARLRERARDGGVHAVPGAAAALDALRAAEVAVVLVGGVAAETRDALVGAAGLPADLLLGPADVGGRGLPEPDLVLAAAEHADADPADVVVVADTVAGMVAAARAGAGLALGVTGGAHTGPRLRAAGAHALVGSAAEVPDRLGLPTRPDQPGLRPPRSQAPAG